MKKKIREVKGSEKRKSLKQRRTKRKRMQLMTGQICVFFDNEDPTI